MSKKWTTKLIRGTIIDILTKAEGITHVSTLQAKMPSLDIELLKSNLQHLIHTEGSIVYINNQMSINGYKLNEAMDWNKQISKIWRRPVHELYNTQECRRNAR